MSTSAPSIGNALHCCSEIKKYDCQLKWPWKLSAVRYWYMFPYCAAVIFNPRGLWKHFNDTMHPIFKSEFAAMFYLKRHYVWYSHLFFEGTARRGGESFTLLYFLRIKVMSAWHYFIRAILLLCLLAFIEFKWWALKKKRLYVWASDLAELTIF